MKFLSRMMNKPLIKFEKYRENLRICGDFIYSYETPVAEIHHKAKEVIVAGYFSQTTSKHINYVCNLLGYKKVYDDSYLSR